MSVSSSNGAPGEATVRPAVEVGANAGTLQLRRPRPGLPGRAEINELGRLANYLAKSGFFKDVQGGYQAFAKLLFGRDLGLSATAALTGVHIVEGKPELSANIQAQMVRCYMGVGGERYDYKVVSGKQERHERCEIEFYRIIDGRRETLGTSEFTIEDAERAGLTSPTRNGQPSNYTKFPPNMLFARAMSNGVAFHCPEVTRGIRVYHEGEIESPAPPRVLADADAGEMIPEAEVVTDEPTGAEAEAQRQDEGGDGAAAADGEASELRAEPDTSAPSDALDERGPATTPQGDELGTVGEDFAALEPPQAA